MYSNSLRNMLIYDKGKKAGISGNLLRIELQIKRRDLRKLNPSLSDLRDADFMGNLGDKWESTYRTIRKVKRLNFRLTPDLSPTDLLLLLAKSGLERRGGEVSLIAQIRAGIADSNRRFKLAEKVRLVSSIGDSEQDEALISELDTGIDIGLQYGLELSTDSPSLPTLTGDIRVF